MKTRFATIFLVLLVILAWTPARGQEISGHVLIDTNRDGMGDEPPSLSAAIAVYLDANDNQRRDEGEAAAEVSPTDGQYTFENLEPGTHIVRLDLEDRFVSISPGPIGGSVHVVELAPTGSELADFEIALAAWVRGSLWEDVNGDGALNDGEPRLPGFILSARGTAASSIPYLFSGTSDQNGAYSIKGIPPGSVSITAEAPDPGWAGDDTREIDADGQEYTVDFGFYRPATLTIQKWLDADNDLVLSSGDEPGAEIEFEVMANGSVEAAGVTNSEGLLTFASLRPGSKTVRENTPEGIEPIAPEGGATTIDLESGGDLLLVFLNTASPDTTPPVTSDLLDWGDLPDGPYPTLKANGGAFHKIKEGFFLGASVDPEGDGLPGELADGDDNSASDDEDGVRFLPSEKPHTLIAEVTASAPGFLNAWIDFDNDGELSAADAIAVDAGLVAGPNLIEFDVPTLGRPRYSRFRFNSAGGLGPGGGAEDGEVEDHLLRMDYGDAPDESVPSGALFPTGYPTILAMDGARHIIVPGVHLGPTISEERDGEPWPFADFAFDDDGVLFDDGFVQVGNSRAGRDPAAFAGTRATIYLLPSVPGKIDAWIDWNRDGKWDGVNEQVFDSETATVGVALAIDVPHDAEIGYTIARFRFSKGGGLDPTGLAPDGEVEDYVLAVLPVIGLDFGDAPEPYPTILENYGAAHIASALRLGRELDMEFDGRPHPLALGDDLEGLTNDEDGISFATGLFPGETATVLVTVTAASTGEYPLNAWIDFNQDGDWDDAGEQIFKDVRLSGRQGTEVFELDFEVPDGALEGHTFARFRISTVGGLMPADSMRFPIYPGEVEDLRVEIGGTSTARIDAAAVPAVFRLYPNYPNPFNPETAIIFDLPEPATTILRVYNALGQEVGRRGPEQRASGRQTVVWNARDLPSGVYMYSIEADRHRGRGVMLLIK